MDPSPLHVLIIEDEPGHAVAIQRAFAHARPHDTLRTVGSLKECWGAIAAADPDIVVTDIQLSDGKAFELLNSPGITDKFPFIVMTSYGNEAVAVEAIKAGAIDYVVKSPETLNELPRTVERVMREWAHVQDVKKARDALALSQAELKSVFDGTPVMLCVIDSDRRVLTANRAFNDFVSGVSHDVAHEWPCGVLGCIRALDDPDGCGCGPRCGECALRIAMVDTLRSGKPHIDVECEIPIRRDGEEQTIFFLGSATPMPPVDGESRALVSLLDITDRKRVEEDLHRIEWSRIETQKKLIAREQEVLRLFAEAQRSRKVLLSIMEDDRLAHDALHASEERFRSVVETATDAIITVDADGMIVVWNRAATQVFGYEYDEIIGRSFALLLPEAIQEQHVVGILKAIESGVLPSPLNVSKVVGLKKDGSEFPAEIAFGVVMQKDSRLITAIVRDITERKLIEQEALRTAQLVSIGELAAGVAHEINNPIMGVINYAQILFNKISKQGGETEIPEKIIKEGTRIAGIVSNLLNFSRSGAENIHAVPVQAVFDPSFQLVQKLFQQSDVAVEVRLNDGLPCVMVRAQKMQQVFINLLSNALHALNMRFPGPHADKKIEIWSEELVDSAGVFVRVVFLDHGCGIAPEHLARICNPFFTTKPTGQGTGLGLSISHTIVKEHGGRLLFESELGQYTRVMVDLPAEGR